jgi:MarR family 2-MHQ and catechol resistance regulon transcriptional repressor
MTGITKRLEKTGCILRTNDVNDERLKWLEITDKGKELLNRVFEEKEKNVRHYLKDYPYEKKSQMLEVLREVLQS